MSKKRKVLRVLREWVESIVIAAALAIFLRTFFFQIYKIPTTSMVPVLIPKDKIFVTKLTYGPKIPFTTFRIRGFGKPERGDIVVFVPPREVNKPWFKRKQFIKRLIGIGGDHIIIRNGKIYINDKVVTDPRIAVNKYTNNHGDYGRYGKEIIVPQGKYFFLGDNSENSQDSRFWGFVDEKDIVGKAVLIWWPPKRIEKIG